MGRNTCQPIIWIIINYSVYYIMYMNHLDKVLKLTLTGADQNWAWPPGWTELEKLKFIDEAIVYLEKQEMYEECKWLYELKQTI